jgi:hypothetical protein
VDPDKLTRWLQMATSPLVALGALSGAVLAGVHFLRPVLENSGLIDSTFALPVAIVLPAAAAIALLWISFRFVARTSHLLRRERFDLRVRSPDDLLGRENDVEDLIDITQNFSLVFIDGESGSGKSSLIQYGFVPAVKETLTLLPVLVSRYSGDWDTGLSLIAYDAIWVALKDVERNRLGLTEREPVGSVNADTIGKILRDIAKLLGRQTLLIFDQFDDYQLANRSKFVTKQGAWISAARTKSANKFWGVVYDSLTQQQAKLLFVVRSDASTGLHSVRFTEANAVRPVLRLNPNWFNRLLDQVLRDDGRGPVIANPEDGWSELRQLVQLDLARSGALLPQQVRITLLGLRELSALTPGRYRQAGRAEGVEALYISDAIRLSAETSGLTEAQIRSLLLEFVERGPENSIKTRTRSDADLAKLVMDDAARQKALERLVRDEIVRQREEDVVTGLVWQLDHDYLAGAIVAEERASNHLAVVLRDAAEAWDSSSGWLQRYRTLLPIRTQLTLAWAKLRAGSTFSYESHRRFAILSLLRAAPPLLVVIALAGWALWIDSDAYQINRMVALAPQVRSTLGDRGAPQWASALALSGHADEALSQAHAVTVADRKAEMLARVAEALAERGDANRAIATLHESMLAAPNSPENKRMEIYEMIIDAAGEIARSGATDPALDILREVRSSGLTLVPKGNNHVYISLKLSRMLLELGKTAESHDILERNFTQASEDKLNMADFIIQLYKAGDKPRATQLLSVYQTFIQNHDADRAHEIPLYLAKLSCVYEVLGENTERIDALNRAIEAVFFFLGCVLLR